MLGTRGCRGATPVPPGDGEAVMRGMCRVVETPITARPRLLLEVLASKGTWEARNEPGPGFPPWLEGSVQCLWTRPWINTGRAGRAAAQPRRLVPRAQKVKYIYLLPSPGGSVTPQLWGSAWGKGSAGRELKGSSVVSHESLDTRMAPPARRCCEMCAALIWFHPSPGTEGSAARSSWGTSSSFLLPDDSSRDSYQQKSKREEGRSQRSA